MPSGSRVLSTADARRADVLTAAVAVFAARGFWGANTTEIARAAGISQAYLYRLFENKEALFVAALGEVKSMIEAEVDRVLLHAERGSELDALLADGGGGLAGGPDAVMVLLHAVAASGVEPIGDAVRDCYRRQADHLSARGLSPDGIRRYFAWSQYDNAMRAAGITSASLDERDRVLARR